MSSFLLVSNNLLIKVSNVQVEAMQDSTQQSEDLLPSGIAPRSIAQTIFESQWRPLFSGTVIVQVHFLDEDFAVFNLDFLGRVSGKQ